MEAFDQAALRTTECLRATLSCLASRWSILAIGLLILNDHVLKASHPSWITGKLSDFAGLFFAPFLLLLVVFGGIWLVQLLCRRSQLPAPVAGGVAASACALVGLLFAALKLSPETAEPAHALLAAITGRSYVVVVDPSDLMALTVLPLSLVVWRRQLSRRPPGEESRALGDTTEQGHFGMLQQGAVVAIALIAVMATSPPSIAPGIISVAVDPHDRNGLFASKGQISFFRNDPSGHRGSDPPILYRSGNGGATWRELGDGGERILPDPSRPGTLYLARRSSLWRLQAGESQPHRIWPPQSYEAEELNDGPDLPRVEAPGWGQGLVYLVIGPTLLRSLDWGTTWVTLSLPAQEATGTLRFASAPGKPGLLFLAIDRELFSSPDGGDSWRMLTVMDMPPLTLQVDPRDSDLLLAGVGSSLLKSRDGGLVWERVGPVDAESGSISVIVFNPERDTVYAVAGRGGLLASEDRGNTWTRRLGDHRVHDVAITSGSDQDVVVAAGLDGVYRQRNPLRFPGLDEWQTANFGLMPQRGILFGPRTDGPQEVVWWLTVHLGFSLLAYRLILPFRASVHRHPWGWGVAAWIAIPSIIILESVVGPTRLTKPADLYLIGTYPVLALQFHLLPTKNGWLLVGLAPIAVVTWIVGVIVTSFITGGFDGSSWIAGLLWLGTAPLAFLLGRRPWTLARSALFLGAFAANGLQWVLIAKGFPFGFS